MNDIDDTPAEMILPPLTPSTAEELDALCKTLRSHGVEKFELGVMSITFGVEPAVPEPARRPDGPPEVPSKITGLTPSAERDLYGG